MVFASRLYLQGSKGPLGPGGALAVESRDTLLSVGSVFRHERRAFRHSHTANIQAAVSDLQERV
jgi:hypothetical protein